MNFMSSITFPENVEYRYDVVIIGGGFAGSVLAHYLKQMDNNVSLLIVERDYLGSHEPSYYVPKDIVDELGLQDHIINTINQFTYSIDIQDFASVIMTGGEIVIVSYKEVCDTLTKGIEIVNGEFVGYVDRSKKIINIMRDEEILTIAPKIVIDATGWESSVRKSFPFLSKPKIGCFTYLLELENCSRDFPWDNMILVVGDYASYFWIEPNEYEKGTMKVGVGLWGELDDDIEDYKSDLRDRMYLYLHKYRLVFEKSRITKKHFAKISADPVKEIVFDNTVFFGEAVGMTNPYWLLGSSLYVEYARKFTPIILQSVKDRKHLIKIQEIWNAELSKYGKLWAGARIMWVEDSNGWLNVLKRREILDRYTKKEHIIERQSGGSYSLMYLYRMWGIKRLIKAGIEIVFFKLRVRSTRFRDNHKIKYRQNYVDINDPDNSRLIKDMQKLFEHNKRDWLQVQENFN